MKPENQPRWGEHANLMWAQDSTRDGGAVTTTYACLNVYKYLITLVYQKRSIWWTHQITCRLRTNQAEPITILEAGSCVSRLSLLARTITPSNVSKNRAHLLAHNLTLSTVHHSFRTPLPADHSRCEHRAPCCHDWAIVQHDGTSYSLTVWSPLRPFLNTSN